MATLIRTCRKCGAKIFSDAPEGLCTGCALESALGRVPGAVVADAEWGPVEDPQIDDAPAEPHVKTTPYLTKVLGELGDYELLEEVGRGGQGVVFRARQKSLNRIIALKVIGLGQWATQAHLKRFRLEAEAAASLDHPCIVPIYEIGERDGQCYFSMKFVEGGQLDEVVKHTPISIRQAAELISKLAHTVHYAHEHGILHRDIKPGNILLDKKGEPHLTDFGLARLVESESTVTRTVEVLGTPSYMAPEQAVGNNTKSSHKTDVYGLGAVLYHLLTGHPPFAGGTTYETIKLLLETEQRPPRLWNTNVDRDLSTICQKCLEKDPQRRYSSASALADDLERWLKHEPIQARPTGIIGRGKKWLQRNPTAAMAVALSLALVAAIGVILWKSELFRPAATGIAVLPFENLSNDREDASFADGVQDDLLTKLAKIASLKVISRTSVTGYRGKQNTRQIGDALGVSHVLEGSVRKTGAWLHINAQLIDTRTDSHIWAEEYDRDLKDMFAMQSEIAKKVAERLHVKISAAERQAIERPPTADLTAFDLYSRAKSLLLTLSFDTPKQKTNALAAADLLNQAVAHDPTFFQAYCQLAWIHDHFYYAGLDRTPARLLLAEAAIQAAFRLRPDAGEVHLARAWNLYWGYRDYDGALAELDIAGKTLPNDARLFELKGYIERRRPGGDKEALRNLERAIQLDPRNIQLLQQTASTYENLRRYADEKALWDRALSLEPSDILTKVSLAFVEFDWKADARPLHQLIDEIRAKDPNSVRSVAYDWFVGALAERDSAAAANALAAGDEDGMGNEIVKYTSRFMEGLVGRMEKDDAKARAAFNIARAEQEKLVRANPDDAGTLAVLGLIDAALGRKEEALREGRRAVELLPAEKDSINGAVMVACLATIAAWVGDKDLACQEIVASIRYSSYLSYGQLKLMPWWDPLRGDPCFEKIVASLAPK
jgi:TolB-like protein/Tfp pilus assembly protein PilF/predicted Ser/Thr protein kinase